MSTNYFSALELFLQVIVVLPTIDKASTCICLGKSHRLRLIIVLRRKAVDWSRRKGKANDKVASSKVNPASLTFMPQLGCLVNRQLTCKCGWDCLVHCKSVANLRQPPNTECAFVLGSLRLMYERRRLLEQLYNEGRISAVDDMGQRPAEQPYGAVAFRTIQRWVHYSFCRRLCIADQTVFGIFADFL